LRTKTCGLFFIKKFFFIFQLLLSLPFFALSRLNLREIKYNSLSTQDRLKHLKNYGTFDESNIDGGGGKLVVGEERKEVS